jgi:formylmethanofuran dehydrogenase subunit E
MEPFDELLRPTRIARGRRCAGHILSVRMATLACRRLEVQDPRGANR